MPRLSLMMMAPLKPCWDRYASSKIVEENERFQLVEANEHWVVVDVPVREVVSKDVGVWRYRESL